MEFPAISLACCVCMNINCDCAYAHMKNYAACALQFACCGLCCALCCGLCKAEAVLRPAAKNAASRSTQIAARRPHRNSIAILVEIQRKFKYVQLGAARGLRPASCSKV